MKEKIATFLLKLYTKIIGRPPCIIYRRLTKYTNRKDGFANDCPFCDVGKIDLIEKTTYWNVIKNKYPYPNTQSHLLVIPNRHISKYNQLKNEELMELKDILAKYLDKGYLLLGRQFGGHPESSVEHLHLHFIKNNK